jgi:hypothetical protein
LRGGVRGQAQRKAGDEQAWEQFTNNHGVLTPIQFFFLLAQREVRAQLFYPPARVGDNSQCDRFAERRGPDSGKTICLTKRLVQQTAPVLLLRINKTKLVAYYFFY